MSSSQRDETKLDGVQQQIEYLTPSEYLAGIQGRGHQYSSADFYFISTNVALQPGLEVQERPTPEPPLPSKPSVDSVDSCNRDQQHSKPPTLARQSAFDSSTSSTSNITPWSTNNLSMNSSSSVETVAAGIILTTTPPTPTSPQVPMSPTSIGPRPFTKSGGSRYRSIPFNFPVSAGSNPSSSNTSTPALPTRPYADGSPDNAFSGVQ